MITRHKHWTAPLRLVALWVLLLGGVMPALASARPAGPIDPLALNALLIDYVTKLTATDGATNDYLGICVAVDGDTVVVGAYGDDSLRGSAYIFYRHQGGIDAWGLVAKLVADDGVAGDSFGQDVAVDGDTIVVGALGDDSERGAAYVFYRDQDGADAWGQVAKLTAADGATGDSFGYVVAIRGDTVVVGAPHDDDSGIDSGSAYIFYRDQGGVDAWGQVTKLIASDATTEDHFAYSVAMSGSTVVIGSYHDDHVGRDSGSAYVFERDQGGADVWGQTAKLTASDAAADDLFGWFVAVDGDTIVATAPWDEDHGDNSGAAYVFDRNQGGANIWGQTAKLVPADGAALDNFGSGVSVSGDTIVVGAYLDDDMGSGSGSAYVFDRNEGGVDAWGQVDKLTAADGAAGDQFGYTVSLNNNTLVVGAYWDDAPNSNSGSAYVLAASTPDPARIKYLPLVVNRTCYPYCP